MRKKSYTVRCDNPDCQKYDDVEENQTPEGWYNVRQADEALRLSGTVSGSFDLCSLKCVRDWAKARAAILGVHGSGMHFVKEPCPYCDDGSEFAPQGMVRHIETTHGTEFVTLWRESRAQTNGVTNDVK